MLLFEVLFLFGLCEVFWRIFLYFGGAFFLKKKNIAYKQQLSFILLNIFAHEMKRMEDIWKL